MKKNIKTTNDEQINDSLDTENIEEEKIDVNSMVIQSFYKALEPDIFQKYNSESVDEVFTPYLRKMNNIYNFALFALALALSLFAKEALIIVASKSYYSAAFYVPFVLVGVISSGRNPYLLPAAPSEFLRQGSQRLRCPENGNTRLRFPARQNGHRFH